jgi:hypothetical protein
MINIEKHLTPDQLEDYREYRRVWNEAWANGSHHWLRIAKSRNELEPVHVEDCVPYAPPYDLDAPCAVLHPSPRFIAELMAGGIHPPLSALLEQQLLIIAKDGTSAVVSKVEAEEWRAKHAPIAGEYVVDNRRAHLEVEGPLTYEQAIEYTIMKDIPVAVWGRQHNQRQFMVVKKASLPDRSNRNSWKLADMELAA